MITRGPKIGELVDFCGEKPGRGVELRKSEAGETLDGGGKDPPEEEEGDQSQQGLESLEAEFRHSRGLVLGVTGEVFQKKGQFLKDETGTVCNGTEGIVCNNNGETGGIAELLVEAANHGASTSKEEAPVD